MYIYNILLYPGNNQCFLFFRFHCRCYCCSANELRTLLLQQRLIYRQDKQGKEENIRTSRGTQQTNQTYVRSITIGVRPTHTLVILKQTLIFIFCARRLDSNLVPTSSTEHRLLLLSYFSLARAIEHLPPIPPVLTEFLFAMTYHATGNRGAVFCMG